MMKQTNSYGTVESQPLINKPSNKSSKSNCILFSVGILMLMAMVFGLFHTNSFHSTNSNLITSDTTREYSIEGEVCDLQYAGDSALNDVFNLYITTAEGDSEATQIPQSSLVRGGEFKFTITAALGLDVRSATIETEALDAICIKKVSVSVGDESFSKSGVTEWISGNCVNTPTLTPCDSSHTFEFLYYFLSPAFGDWEEVRESCQEEGGDLAIFDGEKIDTVYEICEAAVADETGKSCYVGFDDFDTLNTWLWIDGDAFDLYDYVSEDEFHTSSWDRCGCISMRYTEAQPLADCTCDYTYSLYGVCQSEAIDSDTSSSLRYRPRLSPKGSSMDETKPDIE